MLKIIPNCTLCMLIHHADVLSPLPNSMLYRRYYQPAASLMQAYAIGFA